MLYAICSFSTNPIPDTEVSVTSIARRIDTISYETGQKDYRENDVIINPTDNGDKYTRNSNSKTFRR